MTDVFLYQGEPNPNDVKLRDPTVAANQSAASIVDAGGIAGAEAVGQPAVTAVLSAAAIASAEALGAPAISARVQASAIASAEALGAPNIAARVAADGVASAEAFGQPFVGTPAQIVDAGDIASAEAFGLPIIEQSIDGSGLIVTTRRKRRIKAPIRPRDRDRLPEDIAREQRETERYLASLEKPTPKPVPARARVPEYAGEVEPAAAPILADVVARAASAVQDKLDEADKAAALVLANKKRRQTMALLLALD